MKNILGACLSCGRFFDLKSDFEFFQTQRCGNCRSVVHFRGKFGSLIVRGALTQRELAEVKRDLYKTEKILALLDKRKAEFIRKAMEEADKLVAEVESTVGQPLKDLRQQNSALKEKLKVFMQESGQNEIRIRDLLVTVKNEVINAGNRPMWSVFKEKVAQLLNYTEDQINELVKSTYSLPQLGVNMSTRFLPPGRKNKPTAYVKIENLKTANMKEIQGKIGEMKEEICRIDSGSEVFILTNSLIKENGLPQMMDRQSRTKSTLSVSDIEQQPDGRMLVMVEGVYVRDPNTVRSFLAERLPTYVVNDVMPINKTKIAVELSAPQNSNAQERAVSFFDRFNEIFTSLMTTEKAISELTSMDAVGRNQADTPDNVDDLYLKWERAQPAGGGPGSFGNGAQEGIMTPESGSPKEKGMSQTGCTICGREIFSKTASSLCTFCEIEVDGSPYGV